MSAAIGGVAALVTYIVVNAFAANLAPINLQLATLTNRVLALEELSANQNSLTERFFKVESAIPQIEQDLGEIKATMVRLEQKIDRLTERSN